MLNAAAFKAVQTDVQRKVNVYSYSTYNYKQFNNSVISIVNSADHCHITLNVICRTAVNAMQNFDTNNRTIVNRTAVKAMRSTISLPQTC